MAANHSRAQRRESRPCFHSLPLKVSPTVSRLCRRAWQHSTLTSFQQLRKDSHTAVRSSPSRSQKWDGQRHRRGHLSPICQRRRSRSYKKSTMSCVSTFSLDEPIASNTVQAKSTKRSNDTSSSSNHRSISYRTPSQTSVCLCPAHPGMTANMQHASIDWTD